MNCTVLSPVRQQDARPDGPRPRVRRRIIACGPARWPAAGQRSFPPLSERRCRGGVCVAVAIQLERLEQTYPYPKEVAL